MDRWVVSTYDGVVVHTDAKGAKDAVNAQRQKTVWLHPGGSIAGADIRRVEKEGAYNSRVGIDWGKSDRPKELPEPDNRTEEQKKKDAEKLAKIRGRLKNPEPEQTPLQKTLKKRLAGVTDKAERTKIIEEETTKARGG